jgi:ABC-type antimicrobial peptide transport system permease subunit
MLTNYLKFAWRNLLKNKGFSLINISGLAIGMTVAVLIGLWLRDEFTFNRNHLNYERLAGVWLTQTFDKETRSGAAVAIPLADELRNHYSQDFKRLARTSWSRNHSLANGSERRIMEEGMFVEPAFPEMFSLQMTEGDISTALTDINTVIICESVAKALFGKEPALNKTLLLDNEKNVKVTGVFKDLPYNSAFQATKMFMPWAMHASEEWVKSDLARWDNHSWQLFAELNDATQMGAISQKIANVEMAHNKGRKPFLFLQPLSRWHLYGEFKDGKNIGGRIQYVWLFGIIGIFVLLLACINFMNLATARSEKRAREVGVRKAIGSMRSQLVGQFMSESLLVSTLALVFALAMVWMFLPGFNILANKEIVFPATDPVFWASMIGFTLFTALLAGSYPAFYLSSFQPLKVLKGTFRVGRLASLPRKVLVVVQFTVSVSLIIGTMVIFKQIEYAKNRPVGYVREGLLQTRIGKEMKGHYETVRRDLLETGAVSEMSWSNGSATSIQSNQVGFDWQGKDPTSQPIFAIVNCTHDFGKSIGWEIKEGRDFSKDFATDSAALVLNESAARLIGLDNIVGRTIKHTSGSFHVVGVVKDMVMESPYTPIKPTIFLISYKWVGTSNIRLTPGVPVQTALAKVKTVIEKHSPGAMFEFDFADEEYNAKFKSEERIGKLAQLFAFLTIFISCLGLFGLSAFVAEQRTKEIGVRKVLGASAANLWVMLSKDFLLLVLISCLLAIPLAWHYLDNWLQDYEYRVALKWQFFGLAVVLAISVTLLTVSFQSVKATLANPVKSLRSE